MKVMPSAKDGPMLPFPVVTPGFIRSLGRGRKADEKTRVTLAKLAERLAAMIEALDAVEMDAAATVKPRVGELLDDLNGAYQKASGLAKEMAQEAQG